MKFKAIEPPVQKEIDGEKGWWLFDPNNDSCPNVGPYERKADANEDRIGMNRSYRAHWKEWEASCEEYEREVEEKHKDKDFSIFDSMGSYADVISAKSAEQALSKYALKRNVSVEKLSQIGYRASPR